jgi:hypothetical protein
MKNVNILCEVSVQGTLSAPAQCKMEILEYEKQIIHSGLEVHIDSNIDSKTKFRFNLL